MIISQTESGWQLIHQPAHGLLALQLALAWKVDKRPPYWAETLLAVAEHDDGQVAWEKQNHLTAAGAPLHFQLVDFSLKQCQNLIQIGLQKSRWNALLLSMHTSFLYESRRGTNQQLDTFLDQQQTNQSQWRNEMKASEVEANYAYKFLQWCDALSLALCLKQIPPEERRLEVSKGPKGEAYYLHQRTDNSLALEPWPFELSTLEVHVETVELNQLVFKSDHQLNNAIQEAPVVVHRWTFKR
ncbi:DUF3891 family protein [Spirosoma sp. HMF4905]|uniref:DUF3891 family protein n=1 Tax=Spirosoma arboris TaxID=2682092 RepID=A0A7K1SQX9_9BACT|nr:DUF3891 family protein [Spirosoma arboris]MVM36208.1 DUF3891 family protein [Spirosoma arboris]